MLARVPGSSRATCRPHGRFDSKTLYRCTVDVETGTHAMRPSASCFTYANGSVEDVTRQVGTARCH